MNSQFTTQRPRQPKPDHRIRDQTKKRLQREFSHNAPEKFESKTAVLDSKSNPEVREVITEETSQSQRSAHNRKIRVRKQLSEQLQKSSVLHFSGEETSQSGSSLQFDKEDQPERALAFEEDHAPSAFSEPFSEKSAPKQESHTPARQRKLRSFSAQNRTSEESIPTKSRLRFTAEEMQNFVSSGVLAGTGILHQKVAKEEQDNTGLQAAHRTEQVGEVILRSSSKLHAARQGNRSNRRKTLKFQQENVDSSPFSFASSLDEASLEIPLQSDHNHIKTFFKRRRQKERLRAACQAAKWEAASFNDAGNIGEKFSKRLFTLRRKEKHTAVTILGILMVLLIFFSMFSSCGTALAAGADAFLQTTWLSKDEDIQKAELYYTRLEAQLQRKVNQIETSYPGYDEYRLELDEIGHDPVELISYLSAKAENGIFVYDMELERELNEIFEEQYVLTVETSTETKTHTRTIHAGESLGNVVTSAYCPCSICCGKWAGGPTASGVYPRANHTLAVDAYDPIVPMGTEVIINGNLYKVEDTGNLNKYGVNFDVYMDSHWQALLWGHKTFEAYIAGNQGEEIEVTVTDEVSICTVKLKKKSFDNLASRNLNFIEQEQYRLYCESGGNRPFLASPVMKDWRNSIAGLYGYRCSEDGTLQLHEGLDLSLAAGTAIYAPFDGTVSATGQDRSLGKYVRLTSEEGYEVIYAHCSRRSVSTGETISKGKAVAFVGSSGDVSEPTLHIELWYNGVSYNPYFYLQSVTE